MFACARRKRIDFSHTSRAPEACDLTRREAPNSRERSQRPRFIHRISESEHKMIYDNILDTIGNTPIVKLHRLPPQHVDMYVKVEAFNPGGSVKDRLAIAIILDAEQKGL